MPGCMYPDINGSVVTDEHRAIQLHDLALELSMFGLATDEDGNCIHRSSPPSFGAELEAQKQSANMTECVPVPSSEHVAEIVGRQGCKIKALRAKTNTYIKTPVRGEEPVFVVTGRKDDVTSAKREILSAAEHFSQIRASRRNSSVSSGSSNGSTNLNGPPSPNAPGQTTIQVRVPYRVVGLVVGPKGATIKRIQQQTHTYIVTPSRDKEPVFEVTGLPENVDKARQEIESHIAMRTGGVIDGVEDPNDFHSNGIDSGFHEMSNNDLISSLYMNKPVTNGVQFNNYNNCNNILSQSNRQNDAKLFNFNTLTDHKITDYPPNGVVPTAFNGFGIYDSSDEGIGGSPSFDPISSSSIWADLEATTNLRNKSTLVSLFSNSTPTTSSLPRRSCSLGSNCTNNRVSPTLTDSNGFPLNPHQSAMQDQHHLVRRIRSDPSTASFGSGISSAFTPFTTSFCPTTNGFGFSSAPSVDSNNTSSSSTSPPLMLNGKISPVSETGSDPRRNCLVCAQNEIVAALVPCGHNLFCMDCAEMIVDHPVLERKCPICNLIPTQAIRIIS